MRPPRLLGQLCFVFNTCTITSFSESRKNGKGTCNRFSMFLLTDQEDEVKSYYLDEKKGERGGEKKRLDLCMIHYLLTILHPLSPRIAHPPIRLYMHPEKLDKNAQI